MYAQSCISPARGTVAAEIEILSRGMVGNVKAVSDVARSDIPQIVVSAVCLACSPAHSLVVIGEVYVIAKADYAGVCL